MLWWQQFVGICVILLVFKSIEIPFGNLFSLDISKKAVFLPPIPIGVPYLPTQIERQAEIKPFAPDTDNAETGNRVPHHSSIDLLNY